MRRLGEHGEKTHGVLVHDATLLVPLVIRAPGLHVADTIAQPVHLIDVMPTMLSLLGLDEPAGVQGRDLGTVAARRVGCVGAALGLCREPLRPAAPRVRAAPRTTRRRMEGSTGPDSRVVRPERPIRKRTARPRRHGDRRRSAELAVALEGLAADLEGGDSRAPGTR